MYEDQYEFPRHHPPIPRLGNTDVQSGRRRACGKGKKMCMETYHGGQDGVWFTPVRGQICEVSQWGVTKDGQV